MLPVLAVGCARSVTLDYRASPVLAAQDWGDRLHLERSGVRVLVGPVAVFPYASEGEDGGRRGQYQLFTRVMVENVGVDAVEVLWSGARLDVPGGRGVRLVDSRFAAALAAGAEPAAPDEVERLAPGERTMRALIPSTLYRIGVGEPLVPLCDGCEYRLVLPVRVGGRRELLELPFRLTADRISVSVAPSSWSATA